MTQMLKTEEILKNNIFTYLDNEFRTEGYFDGLEDQLNYTFLSTYGELNINRNIERLLSADNILTVADYQMLAKQIKLLYSTKWARFAEINNYEYNPGWNVDGTEKEVETWVNYKERTIGSSSHTSEQTTDATSTTEQLDAATATTEQLEESTNKNYIVGDNSTDEVEVSKATSDSGKTKTTTDDGKVKTTTNDGKTEDSDSHTDEKTITGTHTIEKIRGGNIGVTMTTQLFRDSQMFFDNFNFYSIILKDVSKVLCGGIWVC